MSGDRLAARAVAEQARCATSAEQPKLSAGHPVL